jgi:hypothetical protein
MTRINTDEYNALKSFDQALVWAVITLAEANRSPDNSDLLNYLTIRPEARDFVNWQVQLDSGGQPYLTFSMLFPLVDHNPLQAKPGLPLKIPTYTDFQPVIEPATIPATGQGLPLPPIPAEIETLERLACWLGLIAYQLHDFIRYCNGLNSLNVTGDFNFGLPIYTIDVHGLTFEKPLSESALYAQRGAGGGGTSTAAEAFAAINGDSPTSPNNADLIDKIAEARDQQAATTEPPQVNPGAGYDRIDTLPVCKDQDPSVKAYNKPLREILK